jgi:hypothetical protein
MRPAMVVMTLPTNIALPKGVNAPRLLAFTVTIPGGSGFSPRRPQFR